MKEMHYALNYAHIQIDNMQGVGPNYIASLLCITRFYDASMMILYYNNVHDYRECWELLGVIPLCSDISKVKTIQNFNCYRRLEDKETIWHSLSSSGVDEACRDAKLIK